MSNISLAAPYALLLMLPVPIILFWWMLGFSSGPAYLPGHWNRLIEPALRSFMSRYTASESRSRIALIASIWTLLVLALAQPSIDNASPSTYTNIAARIIVLDLDGQADIHKQRLAVSRLIDGAPDIPTALIVATAESYEAVPMTTDRTHLERYLQVIKPDVMPLGGRALALAAAHAEGLLIRASIIAGQVVVITAGVPVQDDVPMPSRWPRALVITSDNLSDWQAYADKTKALLSGIDDLGPVLQALERDVERALRQSDQSGRRDLTPWLSAAALLLWLALFRRRRRA